MTTPRSLPVPEGAPPAALPVPPATGRGSSASTALVVVGIAVGSFLLLMVAGYLLLALGVTGVAIAAVVALIPLAIVLVTIRFVDRFEPEPRAALWFAFLWGAGVSVAAALLFDIGVQIVSAVADTPLQTEVTASVVQAPIVEEVAKGFGVLLVLWAGRRYFDGPLDGLVYAAVVAAGFAFTENVLYFGSSLIEGGAGELVTVFVLRGLFSPFAHIIFTSCTGLALGIASRRTGPFGAVLWFLLGLVPAILLHALWNGALLVVTDVIGYYFLVQVPIFAGWVALILTLRVHERRLTRSRLEEYQSVGWFTPSEVDLVASFAGRRQGLAWARAQGAASAVKLRAMRGLIRDATRLAHARQRHLRGRASIGATPDERELLDSIVAQRRVLLS